MVWYLSVKTTSIVSPKWLLVSSGRTLQYFSFHPMYFVYFVMKVSMIRNWNIAAVEQQELPDCLTEVLEVSKNKDVEKVVEWHERLELPHNQPLEHASTHFHRQLLGYLRQYSHYCDLRHLKALVDGECPRFVAVNLASMGALCIWQCPKSTKCGASLA